MCSDSMVIITDHRKKKFYNIIVNKCLVVTVCDGRIEDISGQDFKSQINQSNTTLPLSKA